MRTLKEILIIFILIFISACNNKDTSKGSNKQKDHNKIITSDSLILTDSANMINTTIIETKDNISFWIYDCMIDSILKIRDVNRDTLTYKKLINIINADYKDKVYLDFAKIVYDTIFVKIKNSEYLTQQMGTTGADEYMISTTFTLTELNQIRYVNFDFVYGDHASPGTYDRKHFLDWVDMNKN